MSRYRIAKWLGCAVAVYAVLVLLTLHPGDRRLYPANEDAVTVYVLNNGFHTDIALPASEVRAQGGALADAARALPDSQWLVYGWGDAGFYTARGLSPARILDGLRALFWINNPSVIRLYGLDRSPDIAYAGRVATPIHLSSAGFAALDRHMAGSFSTVHNAPVVYPVAETTDLFFSSHEHFSALRVCNNWTSDQLAAAGLPTAPIADGIALLLRLDLAWRAHAG